MLLNSQEELFANPVAYLVGGLVLLLGLSRWWVAVRTRLTPVLNFNQRLILSILLLGLLLGWWRASKLMPIWQDELSGVIGGKQAFTQITSDRVGVVAPRKTSFAKPEIRLVEGREVLMLLPPAQMEWKLDGRARAVEFGFGFEPAAYVRGTTNGAALIVEVVEENQKREIYRRLLDPIHQPSDRGTQRVTVDLPAYQPGAWLLLRSDPGDYGDTAWDWVYLSGFRFRE